MQCERQFAEAARELKRAFDLVGAQPVEAGTMPRALAKGLADKMFSADELCIRLLSEAAGDKASTHGLNVALISMLMGRSFGLAEADMLDLGAGALMHDIGKLDLPTACATARITSAPPSSGSTRSTSPSASRRHAR